MATSYYRFVVRTSIVKGALIVFNLIAVLSFFFIQVGSIFLILPAAVLDVIYFLNGEGKWVIKPDAIKPASKIAQITFGVIVAILVAGATLLVYGVMNSG
ncbi:hypothetical protein KW801_02925 [Candidatus Saccharibacteria bacterium]|nr:hypothetical protein [Candidatus Saccharibacteria bacterium]